MSEKTRTVKAHLGNILGYFGGIYRGQALELVAQLVENSIDSLIDLGEEIGLSQGDRTIFIELDTNMIAITDNGTGMIDEILPFDQKIIDEFPERIIAGLLPEDADLRPYISRSSRHSFVWMMENIAFSQKIGGERRQRGVRGIGFQGVYSLGNNIEVLSRPTLSFAIERWPGITESEIPTLKLIPPSVAMLSKPRPDLTYTYPRSDQPLRDPYKPLKSGTKVVITNLLEGVLNQLRPGALQSHLADRFGEDIRERGIKILIIDYYTEKGAKEAGGRKLLVSPVEYKGKQIFKRTYHLGKGTEYPFDIVLHLPAKGQPRGQIKLHRMGSAVSNLTDMREFQDPPFTELVGYVEFPTLPDDKDNWDTSKEHLKQTRHRKKWADKILQAKDDILAEMELERGEKQQQELKNYMKNAALALAAAMTETTSFNDIVIKTPPVKTKRKKKPFTPEVDVVVLNQHDRQTKIPDLALQLHPRKGQMKVVDIVGGRFSFGSLPAGTYDLHLTVPAGITLVGDPTRTFSLTRSDLSHRVTYRITTEEVSPEERQPLPKIMPVLDDFGAPMPLYENWLHVGQIRLNLAADPIPDLLGEKDRAKLDLILADRLASALTEYCLSGRTDFLFQERAKLFLSLLRNLGRM